MSALNYLSRFFFSVLLLLLLNQTVCAQHPAKLISVLNSGGSSDVISIDMRKYYYQQSIGQSGLTGLSSGKDHIVRQGFIQPPAGARNIAPSGTLAAGIYPNPFSTFMIISFQEKLTADLFVTIFDMNGRIQYLKKFSAAPELTLDLTGLAPSIYILKINSATKSCYTKIIKLRN